jgi:transposase
MKIGQLFEHALGDIRPWSVASVRFETDGEGKKTLHIDLDFVRGSEFTDTEGHSSKAYDVAPRSWRHLNFFQHECYLHAPVPRVTNAGGQIVRFQVPWARRNTGFTLLFEAYVMSLIGAEMPVSGVAGLVGEHDQRIWNIFLAYVEQGRAQTDYSQIERVGVDETFAHAEITFDRFHVTKEVNKALDEVRRLEQREAKTLKDYALKGHKYTVLYNQQHLSAQKRAQLDQLLVLYPTLGKAYRLRQLFQEFWDIPDPKAAEAYLNNWCQQALDSQIFPFVKVVQTIKSHWSGIIRFIQSQISNGILEGINAKIQLAKRRARGYRNNQHFKAMILFIAGKLNLETAPVALKS